MVNMIVFGAVCARHTHRRMRVLCADAVRARECDMRSHIYIRQWKYGLLRSFLIYTVVQWHALAKPAIAPNLSGTHSDEWRAEELYHNDGSTRGAI